MIRILLIEDNIGDTALVNEYLKEEKDLFSIACCFKLSTGIAKLITDNFDIILLDLNLPDSSGIQTLSAILSNANETPVVVLTYMEDEDTFDKIIKSGAQDYIVKGQYDKQHLIRVIKFAIERKKQNL